MRRYRRQRSTHGIDYFLDKIKSGNITKAEIDALLDEFVEVTVKQVSPPVPEVVLHRIGKVTLMRCRRNDGRYSYEVGIAQGEVDQKWFAGASALEALRRARAAFPKTIKREGEIVAFRAWCLLGDCLTSMNGVVWPGPIMTSDHIPTMDGGGMSDMSGLYAVHATPEGLRWLMDTYRVHCYGFVGLYGTVVEHERGYRASHAVVRRIVLRIPASAAYMKILSDRYECEVVVDREFR